MIRSFPQLNKTIFLTFDDGPNGASTEAVLQVLREREVPATFFLVGKDIRPQEKLVRRMVSEGHALGNHSWDHLYSNYFTRDERLRAWISRTNEETAALGLPTPVGFRPPAGVVTPPLVRTLAGLREPLVMWNERFYDSVFIWKRAKAERSVRKLSGGSVVLLHDGQKPDRIDGFCETLSFYIDALKERGFNFAPLTRELCLTEMR